MTLALIPIVVLVAGLVMVALAVNPKVQTLGKIMFAVGLGFAVWALARTTLFLR